MKSIRNLLVGMFIGGGLIVGLHLLHAQETATPVQGGVVSQDVDSMSDLEVLLQAVELTTPAPAASASKYGTFYSLQHSPGSRSQWPPLPSNADHVPLWDMGDGIYLLDDRNVNYDAPLMPSKKSGMMISADDSGPGGITNTDVPFFSFTPDYGTNLYIAQPDVASNYFSGIVSNSFADIQYEIQYKTDLEQTNWQSANWFVYGSELTNWTPFSVPAVSSSNLFLRVRSWQDDGSGLPIWWQEQYFGTTGVDPYGDPAGDGWNNLQKFQNGMNPNVFYTPPAPQGVTVAYNASNGTASVSWLPSPGPVTEYTVERSEGYWSGGGTENSNVSAGANNFQDNVSAVTPDPFDGGALDVSYQVQAHYAGGASSWSAAVPLEANTISASIVGGSQGSAYVTTTPLPSGTTGLLVTLVDESAWFDYLVFGGGDEPVNPTFEIPVTDSSQNQYLIPAADTVAPTDAEGDSSYAWYVQAIGTNGNSGAPAYCPIDGGNVAAPYFFDGRAQMKQNLIFLLRAATVDAPFGYLEIRTNTADFYTFTNPPDYVYAGFYQLDETADADPSYEENVGSFDPSWPFENNNRYRNFVWDSTHLDSNGRITTGAGGNYYPYNLVWTTGSGWQQFGPGLMLATPAVFQFQPPATNDATIPSLLATNNTRWLASYALDSGSNYLWEIGATNNGGANGLFNNVRNFYGLPFLSAQIAYNGGTTTLSAGNATTANGYFYPETAQPQFQAVEYDFWKASYSPYSGGYYYALQNLPGTAGFSTTNTGDLLITAVAQPNFMVAGYAKLAVQNGYSGAYAYLGQYFDKAYTITNGIVTTNTTGVLSPYGNFFATEPGLAALVTMPDVDTGERGTGVVYCVSLNVDKNHDGTMDLNFDGADITSLASPMEFWINNDHDWSDYAGDPGKDVKSTTDYSDYTFQNIPSQRDLEDYARLWICGMPALTNSSYQVTLSWNVTSGNPAVNLVQSVETNGGIGYLTNATIAAAQTAGSTSSDPSYKFARVTPSQPYTFPDNFFTNSANRYFLFEGAGIGSGELVMTVSQNGNTIAQTGVWLDLHDVKDFFEQNVIQDNMSGSKSNWTSYVETVLPAVSSGLGNDTNMIVLVHGINVQPWDCVNDAETVCKRLYWAGFQGKFAEVEWPCGFFDWSLLSTRTSVFNDSEINAYKASTALTTCLNGLKTRFPNYRLNILAHSQGNAVVSEAIAQGAPFDTYILTQGAMPDSCYDVGASTYSTLTSAESIYPTPEGQPMGYRGIYTNSNFAGNIVNFYNTNDSVLNAWVADQAAGKPDAYAEHLLELIPPLLPVSPYYTYDGTNGWYNTVLGFGSYQVTDPQESRAMLSRSLTQPIGRIGPSDGETQQGVIESTINLATQFGFTTGISEHSAQWTRPIQTSFLYYKQILIQLQPTP